ncbi:MAG: potassium-transporting ATPase subunit KdpC [Polyangiaceae bacterium]|nr:potassium-transporting ATPase subunit KdpC [Polyangiaceae bacterium]
MGTSLYPTLRPALVLIALFTALTGVVYPSVTTAVAQVAFPSEANGSLQKKTGGTAYVGSDLIGQSFDAPNYFWSRPSATGPFPYNAGSSSGSNQGPSSEALRTAVSERIAALRALDPENKLPIPVDLVTASGSGLDPHISPAAALYQVARIAKVRNLPENSVRALVERQTHERTFGILGERYVHVLRLNLALDEMK